MNAHTAAAANNHPLTTSDASRASWLNEMQREFSRRLADLEAGSLPAAPFPTRTEAARERLDRRMRRLFPSGATQARSCYGGPGSRQ